MSKVRLAIIGNGMVGHRFIEDLLDKSDAANFDITVFCEEPRIAYDRVHLSSYFSHHTAEELSLVREGFYEKHGIKVLVGERAITINRQEKVIHSSAGRTVFYDKLIMATGSYPWIPPIKGSDTQDCFVYRTIETSTPLILRPSQQTRCRCWWRPVRSGSRWRAEKLRY
nr:FAD-dependent oxidoreductase [Shigella flexneri]